MNRSRVSLVPNHSRRALLILATAATMAVPVLANAQDRVSRSVREAQQKAQEITQKAQQKLREQQRDRDRAQSRNRSHDHDTNEENTVLDTTVTVEKGTIVDLSATDGRISVRGWDRNEVEIKASAESGELIFSKSPRSVRLEGRRGTRSRTIDVVMSVRVPLNTRVVVNTMLGDVQVLDVRGEVDADLVSGDITIRGASGRTAVTNVSGAINVSDVDGPLRVGAMTGEISLSDVRGPVEVSSNNGDVSMLKMSASAIQVQVVEGDITFDGTLSPMGKYEFGTHSGDVHLFLADNAKGSLELQSFSGTLHSTYPMVLQPDSSRSNAGMVRSFSGSNNRQLGARALGLSQRQHLEFGGGVGAHIVVSTFNGDVHIDRGPSRPKKEQK